MTTKQLTDARRARARARARAKLADAQDRGETPRDPRDRVVGLCDGRRVDETMANTINGYPVIAHFDAPGGRGARDGRVLLIDRAACSGCVGEQYVVAAQYRGAKAGDGGSWDDGWDSGDYISTLPQAFEAFVARIESVRPDIAIVRQHSGI